MDGQTEEEMDVERDRQAALRERVGTEMWDMDGWPDKKTGREKERQCFLRGKKGCLTAQCEHQCCCCKLLCFVSNKRQLIIDLQR